MTASVSARLPLSCSAALPFVVLGAACVVAGGLVAAAVAMAPSQPPESAVRSGARPGPSTCTGR